MAAPVTRAVPSTVDSSAAVTIAHTRSQLYSMQMTYIHTGGKAKQWPLRQAMVKQSVSLYLTYRGRGF